MKRILLFTAFLLFGLYCGIAKKAPLYDLQVDHFYSPSGIDCKAPTFSWKTASKEYDLNQTHHFSTRAVPIVAATTTACTTTAFTTCFSIDGTIAATVVGATAATATLFLWIHVGIDVDHDWAAQDGGGFVPGFLIHPTVETIVFVRVFNVQRLVVRAHPPHDAFVHWHSNVGNALGHFGPQHTVVVVDQPQRCMITVQQFTHGFDTFQKHFVQLVRVGHGLFQQRHRFTALWFLLMSVFKFF